MSGRNGLYAKVLVDTLNANSLASDLQDFVSRYEQYGYKDWVVDLIEKKNGKVSILLFTEQGGV